MGGNEAKRLVIEALRHNSIIRHEPRDVSKNYLATQLITLDDAIRIISATRGQEMEISAHHQDPKTQVFVFKPAGWYIKFYFRAQCWFISFHPEAT